LYQKQEYVKQKVTYMKTLAIILSILFYLTSATAQTSTKPGLTDDEINQLSSNLAMKILLNDSQTTTVTNLLKTYRSDLSKVMSSSIQEAQNKLISSTNAQIVALLDSKQQMKFNVISADWWKSVQEDQNN
jgi:signal recognition particle GTPase